MSSFQSTEPLQPESSTAPASPTLPRGGACLPCRKRKMRCDGAKPACGQCVSKRRADDCEYTNVQGLTRSQMLEENIAILESRIRELENPDESAPSVRLYDPSRTSGPSGQGNVEGSEGGRTPTLRLFDISDVEPLRLPSEGSSSTLFPSPSADLLASQDPRALELTVMVYTFLPYASQFGFFLHAPRFLQLALTAPTAGVRHIDALISAVRLWGSRISKNPALHAREPELLSQAIKQVSDSLFITGQGNRGHDVLYVIQAEVLLANYFFFLNRFLEGRYHCSAAVSLALSCKLNLIGKAQVGTTGAGVGGQLGLGTPVEFPGSSLPEPEDSIQEGERINAFWAVYMLDKVWAVAMESNSSIVDQGSGQTKIDTPWPMPMEAHEAGVIGETVRPQDTVKSFLDGIDVESGPSPSPVALRAKATALYSHAYCLAHKYREDQARYQGDQFALDNYITSFTTKFVFGDDGRSEANQHSLIARVLARVALIQLYNNQNGNNPRPHDACMAAANSALAVVEHLNVENTGHLDPIMAILLLSIGQVFITEITRVKAAIPHDASSTHNDVYLTGLVSSVDRILAILTDFGSVCPLMAVQATTLQQARSTVV